MKKYVQKNVSDINLEDYISEYEGRDALAKDLIFTGGRKRECLNGLWHYAVDQYDTAIRQHWFEERTHDADGHSLPVDFSFDEWPTMMLPCCWNLKDPAYLLYESTMVFTRKFSFNPRENEKVFLKIGAANYLLRVFLNKQYIGMHRGGSTPMCFDVTPYLQRENRIMLVCDAARRPEQVPTENTDWFNYGGIYRNIELYSVPKCFIKDFRISLVPGKLDRIRAEAVLSEKADVQAVLSIPALAHEAVFDINDGKGSVEFRHPGIELWSPENPKLYDVKLTIPGDSVGDRVGFRDIRVEGREIILNGKPVFLRGISCHEDSFVNGKAVSYDEAVQTIRDAKELGCNFMRLAHYPHNERMAKLADEIGMLLWEEIPVYWAIRFRRPATYRDAENQLAELICRDYNRASVIIWSIGNENADSDERLSFMRRLAQYAHRNDRTRLVSAACLVSSAHNAIEDRLAEYIDVIGLNEYYGWYSPDFSKLPELFENSNPEKPVVITEFGADALYGHHGSRADKGTEDCQCDVYEKQIATLREIPYVKGMCPWILYDFHCPRRTSCIQKYFNRKGLMTEDRKHKKDAFWIMQRFYREKAKEAEN